MLLVLALSLLPNAAAGGARNIYLNEAFPDPNFRSYLINYCNPYVDENGVYFTGTQADRMKELYIDDREIADLTGIEKFPNLEVLSCNKNKLKTIDISQNPKLEVLQCSGNALTELDISRNPNLIELVFSDNKLKTIDVSACKGLKELNCSNNLFTEIDVAENPDLEVLICAGNELSEINVRKNGKLLQLDCDKNALTEMDLGGNPSLENLYINDNKISALDLTANPGLKELDCSGNALTELNLQVVPDLRKLNCGDNQLSELDVSANLELTELKLDANRIAALNLVNNQNIRVLSCSRNALNKLNIFNEKKLEELFCAGNQLTEVDVGNAPELKILDCSGNALELLNVSGNTKLKKLDCGNNRLTELNLNNNSELAQLFCGHNRLTEIDILPCKYLYTLYCNDNELKTLAVHLFVECLHCERNHLACISRPDSEYNIDEFHGEGQTIPGQVGMLNNGKYQFDFAGFMQAYSRQSRYGVHFDKDSGITSEGGIITFPQKVDRFTYYCGNNMDVTVELTYEEITEDPVILNGASLTLEGQITINFFVKVPENTKEKTVRLTYDKAGSGTKSFDLDRSAKYYNADSDEYKISYPNIPAKEMGVYVTLRVYDKDDKQLKLEHYKTGLLSGDEYSYCVYDWSNNIIKDDSRPYHTQYLAKALSNYGFEAQNYFGFRSDGCIPDFGLGYMSPDHANDAVIPADAKEKIGYNGASLILEGATSIRLYFKDKVDAKNASGKAYTLKQSGSEWYVEIPNIAAKDLDVKHTVIVTKDGADYRFEYSALSYANGRLYNSKAKADIKNLCRALYLYNDAANKYFAK